MVGRGGRGCCWGTLLESLSAPKQEGGGPRAGRGLDGLAEFATFRGFGLLGSAIGPLRVETQGEPALRRNCAFCPRREPKVYSGGYQA